ncbi:histidine kinase [Glycomyces sp. NPDC046736]|uniref:sensor histidine kinase n=1 Tax=Glycomyces sp. NPDC046736 TaxID=3155615 RepID=UPI0033EACFA4
MTRLQRLRPLMLRFGVVAGLGAILVAESVSRGAGPPPIASPTAWAQAALCAFAIAVWAWYRPGRKRWIAAVAVLSLASSALAVATGPASPEVAGAVVLGWVFAPGGGLGAAEGIALLLLLLHAVRHWDASPGRWVAYALGAAIMALNFRLFAYPDSAAGGAVVFALAMTSVIGFGAYLRGLDRLRREREADSRRAERLELAREMHDFVAHHVTGIVVLSQAAQATNPDPPCEFADIEQAGLAALASMRRTVTNLREDESAEASPVGELAQIEELVDRFARDGTDASCFISPALGDAVSPQVAATAHRIVREALTNVRKHARDARQIRVVLAAASGEGLEVAIRDDGRSASGPLAESGGGMGLRGLRERVAAAGGSLQAGPRAEGGWETKAWLPQRPTTARPLRRNDAASVPGSSR